MRIPGVSKYPQNQSISQKSKNEVQICQYEHRCGVQAHCAQGCYTILGDCVLDLVVNVFNIFYVRNARLKRYYKECMLKLILNIVLRL
jgi:hypothetical protein